MLCCRNAELSCTKHRSGGSHDDIRKQQESDIAKRVAQNALTRQGAFTLQTTWYSLLISAPQVCQRMTSETATWRW